MGNQPDYDYLVRVVREKREDAAGAGKKWGNYDWEKAIFEVCEAKASDDPLALNTLREMLMPLRMSIGEGPKSR